MSTDAAPAPQKPRTDLPTIEGDSRPFWDAVRDDHAFLVVECHACGHIHHYPRPFCPVCWSDDVSWIPASGRATLYTYSIVYMNDLQPFASELPYIAAVVELEEGPRVMTTLVDVSADQLSIGMALTLVTKELTPDVTVPVFTAA
ncbi:OB-fold domain-containing protein [soil metagenome]